MDQEDREDRHCLVDLMALCQTEDSLEEVEEDVLVAEEESEAVVVTWKKWSSSEVYVESSPSENVPSKRRWNLTSDRRKPQYYGDGSQSPWSSPHWTYPQSDTECSWIEIFAKQSQRHP